MISSNYWNGDFIRFVMLFTFHYMQINYYIQTKTCFRGVVPNSFTKLIYDLKTFSVQIWMIHVEATKILHISCIIGLWVGGEVFFAPSWDDVPPPIYSQGQKTSDTYGDSALG